jgi:hypothetical protein
MHRFTQHIASSILLASLMACGGGGSDAPPVTAPTSTPASFVNSLVCSNPGAQVSSPTNAVIIFFSTIYQLEVGTIDPLGAFIQTSSAIFELANDNTANLDGVKVPITSACYQASSNKLTVGFGSGNSLDLTSGGKAVGTINGKAVRTKP